MLRHFIMTPLALALLAFSAFAAQSVTDPAKADKDFAIQGEYTGEVELENGATRIGVQVIALGGGKFHAVAYGNGLPGDGWARGDEKREADGQLAEGAVKFTFPEGVLVIKDNAVTAQTNDGANKGTLRKIVRKSPTLGAKPPEGAIVLFGANDDGKEWTPGKVDNGLLTQGNNTKRKFQGCTLHLEFILPYEPTGRGQGRGNSGCYLEGRYEVQILDSFGLEGKNNECGGIYTISDPAVNMCLPPLQWQTYDIDYTAAEFDASGKKTKNARMTVKHNGVIVQDNVDLTHATTAAPNKEGPEPGFIHIQDHGHPVRFQNIWIVEKK